MVTIFLAHAAADRDRALTLASGLRSAGYAVLAETPPAGDNGWWAGLLAAVQDVDIFLYAAIPPTPANTAAPGLGSDPASATGPGTAAADGEVSVVVAALRDYAAAIGIPTLQVHLSGTGEATGIDLRHPTADATFLLVGAIAALPGRPPVMRWQVQPESPFTGVVDLAQEVQARPLAARDQRALLDRLRAAAANPAIRELAAILRHHPALDPENARHLDETFPPSTRTATDQPPSQPPASAAPASGLSGPGTGGPGAGMSGSGTSAPGTGGLGASAPGISASGPGASALGAGASGPGLSESYLTGPGSGGEAGASGRPWRPPGGGFSADDVRRIWFAKPRLGRRGYAEQHVDEFLDQVEKDLRARYAGGPDVRVSLLAADVRDVKFMRPPRGRRGYDEEEVDVFLDEVESTIAALDRALAAHGSTVVKR